VGTPGGAGRTRVRGRAGARDHGAGRRHALRGLCLADRSRARAGKRRARNRRERGDRPRAIALGSEADRARAIAAATRGARLHSAPCDRRRTRAPAATAAPRRPAAPGRRRPGCDAGDDVRRSPLSRQRRPDERRHARLPALDRVPRVEPGRVLRRLALPRRCRARAAPAPARHGYAGRRLGAAGLRREPGRNPARRRARLVRCGGDVRVPAAVRAPARKLGPASRERAGRCVGARPAGAGMARRRRRAAPGRARAARGRRCRAHRRRRSAAGRRRAAR
jgi:hypothetical protein